MAAVENHELQWALELTDYLIQLDSENDDIISLRGKVLTELGHQQTNPNARHYYLTRALEIGDDFTAGVPVKPLTSMIHGLPLEGIFQSMAVNLNVEKAGDLKRIVNFNFPDTKEKYSLSLRSGVIEVEDYLQPKADITVTMSSNVWKEIVANVRNPLAAFALGDVFIEGSKIDLIRFLDLVKAPDHD